ncbi:MAG: transcriptional regulator PpsR [Gammaproteobacteria bacterium]|nr:transcriptional regulator PpsR [Gammaproteobacteria bacterium]MDE2348580.1 transcriptional regulator PpsR [Gammaproteobacteria bacterium]
MIQGDEVKPFSVKNKCFSELDADTAGKLITVASDIALVLADAKAGVIRDVAFGSNDLADEVADAWIGKPWSETVTVESRPKVDALLRDSAGPDAPRWRMVNHKSGAGTDVPILYAAVKVEKSGEVIAFGRSMRPMATLQQQLVSAQQSMEREFLRLRQTEARHRLLFQLSSEAVLIVDASTRKILEANPAAGVLLGTGAKDLLGRTFPDGFDAAGTDALQSLLAAVRATGRTDGLAVRAAGGDREFWATASLFREERASFFLIRLAAAGAGANDPASPRRESKVIEIVASAPEGFIVTDLDGRVLFSNRAFLDLAQLATEEQARNEPLERWLGRPGVDFNLLTAQLREHGSLRLFATQLRGEFGSTVDVEICAVSVVDGDEPCLGFTIRDVGQRVTFDRQVARDKPRSVDQLTELVGRVPLKDLVRESTDMIEKLCIEAALEITGDNRASAAEILGLSRQSLYAKLRRYGLGELTPADEQLE